MGSMFAVPKIRELQIIERGVGFLFEVAVIIDAAVPPKCIWRGLYEFRLRVLRENLLLGRSQEALSTS
jgi:hypothetical protein